MKRQDTFLWKIIQRRDYSQFRGKEIHASRGKLPCTREDICDIPEAVISGSSELGDLLPGGSIQLTFMTGLTNFSVVSLAEAQKTSVPLSATAKVETGPV